MMTALRVNIDDSPQIHRRYFMLDSPKHGLLSPSALSFGVIFFGSGVIIGSMWNGISPQIEMFDFRTERVFSTISDEEVSSFNTSLREDEDNPSKLACGTSYTGDLVRAVTGLDTASNYGDSNLGEDGTSELVFENSIGGPFWTDPQIHKLKPTKGYILTKTHCGSRCDLCGPESYVENHNLFLKQCLETSFISNHTKNGDVIKSVGSYSKKLVGRAVHLIRDPFDNIVSRFHLRLNRYVKLNDTKSLERYSKSKEGFRTFCSDLSKLHADEEEASKFYQGVIEVVRFVPCHADFFRYIQWHNLAFITTWDLQIPTFIVHYENYTMNFNQTKNLLIKFLEQTEINEPPRFEIGKTYRDYFSKQEVDAILTMFSMLALDKTWHYTRHYFD